MDETLFRGIDLINSRMYRPYMDILACLLDENDFYTEAQVDELLKNFLERQIVEEVNE